MGQKSKNGSTVLVLNILHFPTYQTAGSFGMSNTSKAPGFNPAVKCAFAKRYIRFGPWRLA